MSRLKVVYQLPTFSFQVPGDWTRDSTIRDVIDYIGTTTAGFDFVVGGVYGIHFPI